MKTIASTISWDVSKTFLKESYWEDKISELDWILSDCSALWEESFLYTESVTLISQKWKSQKAIMALLHNTMEWNKWLWHTTLSLYNLKSLYEDLAEVKLLNECFDTTELIKETERARNHLKDIKILKKAWFIKDELNFQKLQQWRSLAHFNPKLYNQVKKLNWSERYTILKEPEQYSKKFTEAVELFDDYWASIYLDDYESSIDTSYFSWMNDTIDIIEHVGTPQKINTLQKKIQQELFIPAEKEAMNLFKKLLWEDIIQSSRKELNAKIVSLRHKITKDLIIQSWAKVSLRSQNKFASPATTIEVIQPFMRQEDIDDMYEEIQIDIEWSVIDQSTYFFWGNVDSINNWKTLNLKINYSSDQIDQIEKYFDDIRYSS